MPRIKIGLFLFLILIGTSTFAQLIDVHKLEKRFAKINDTLYAEKHEVTNSQYRAFLNVIRSTMPDVYKVVMVDSTGWEPFRDFSALSTAYHIQSGYDDFPVVNITLTAARYYCKWLTDNYNNMPKRKFKKVAFRLPTEEEWENAARGEPLDTSNYFQFYAWKGVDVTDKQGNYLCNFKDITTLGAQDKTSDHFVIAAPVDAFKPNKYGLYNICGNVSEMVDMEGIVETNSINGNGWFGVTKGGGWYSPREALKIRSRETYGRPQPYIGFRVFMQVLEP